MSFDWSVIGLTPELGQSLLLTVQLSLVTCGILLIFGLPLAHFLNTCRLPGIVLLETLVTLPIVLPPTVIGFYLLVVFAPESPAGGAWAWVMGHSLAFTFAGLVVGSVIYSLPFAVQPFQAALRAVPMEYREAAATLGADRTQTILRVILPTARRGIAVGMTLSFAHTMGEFGVVMMIGGSIPGVTRVASIALFDEVQKLNYSAAHALAAVQLAISFAGLLLIAALRRRGGAGE